MAERSTEAALRARVRQQAVVADLGRRALAGGPFRELARLAATGAAQALGAPLGKVLALGEGEAEAYVLIGFRRFREGDLVGFGADSQIAFVASRREPVLIDDVEHEQRFTPDELLVAESAVSGVSVAIPSEDGAWGILGVFDTRQRSFSEDDVHFIGSLAHILADAQGRIQNDRRLRESAARARAVLDTTVDAIITIDDRGMILSFNRAAEAIFGYDASEVIGRNVAVLMPEPYHSEHDDYLRSYRETGRRKIIGIGREVTGRRRDGSTFPMDLAVSEVKLDEGVIFTGIVRDISERRRLEQEVLRISDAERRRIGQDLHDGLGQQLTGIGLIMRSMARRLHREDHPEAKTADDVVQLVREADEHARSLARGLVPVELGAEGLSSALQHLVDHVSEMYGVDCGLEINTEDLTRLRDPEVATHLYRIAQEAITNAIRHGGASRIDLILTATPERLRLWIHDDGTGIPEELLNGTELPLDGMGLRIMHYRARIIGGSLDVRPGASDGTTVLFTSPPSSDSPVYRGPVSSADTHSA